MADCSARLWNEGKASPRTCERCGLGPCPEGVRREERPPADMGNVVAEWRAARDVIADFLRELCPDMGRTQREHNAAAVIARLAGHEPPIVLTFHRE